MYRYFVFSGIGMAAGVVLHRDIFTINRHWINERHALSQYATIALMQDQPGHAVELHEHIKIVAAAAVDEDVHALHCRFLDMQLRQKISINLLL